LAVSVAVKPGFHYPSSRAELTARELGCIFLLGDTRVDGCQKMNQSSRAVTRVVETGLYSVFVVGNQSDNEEYSVNM